MTVGTPTDRPKSVRNRCVIAVLCCLLVFDFIVRIGVFVIGPSLISFFFSCRSYAHSLTNILEIYCFPHFFLRAFYTLLWNFVHDFVLKGLGHDWSQCLFTKII